MHVYIKVISASEIYGGLKDWRVANTLAELEQQLVKLQIKSLS